MQRPIERRHGPVLAILISGTLFGIAHFSHLGTVVMMPFYIAVGATYGTMAYLTDSIVPGMVLHSAGNVLDGFPLLLHQSAPPSATTSQVWETGGASIWFLFVGLAVSAAATVWAFAALAAAVRKSPNPEAAGLA